MLKIDREEDVDSDDLAGQPKLDNHQNSRVHRLQQQAKVSEIWTRKETPPILNVLITQRSNDVILLPGTHDGWNANPPEELTPAPAMAAPPPPQGDNRSPIKPITIKTSHLPPSSKGHHKSSSHHKAKKHKKKKKRKHYSESEDGEESECSDPDFMA